MSRSCDIDSLNGHLKISRCWNFVVRLSLRATTARHCAWMRTVLDCSMPILSYVTGYRALVELVIRDVHFVCRRRRERFGGSVVPPRRVVRHGERCDAASGATSSRTATIPGSRLTGSYALLLHQWRAEHGLVPSAIIWLQSVGVFVCFLTFLIWRSLCNSSARWIGWDVRWVQAWRYSTSLQGPGYKQRPGSIELEMEMRLHKQREHGTASFRTAHHIEHWSV